MIEEDEEFADIDIEPVSEKKFKISCCRSYMTPKGRCYTCPDDEPNKDLDGEAL